MHDPVIGLDENLQILFANEEASKITGLKQDDLIGKSSTALALKNDLIRALIRDLVLPNDKQPLNTAPIKIFAENKESYFEKETIDIAIVPTGEHELRSYGHVIFLLLPLSYHPTQRIAAIHYRSGPKKYLCFIKDGIIHGKYIL